MDMQRLAPTRRPLTESERRLLRTRIRDLRMRSRRGSRMSLVTCAVVFVVLWVVTIAASDAPWPIVTAFWVVAGGGITYWVRRDLRATGGTFDRMAGDLRSALNYNAADVYEVRASAFAEFDEIEDEGACYAFEVEGGRLLFISGQEFYPGARFPSLDFSLVYVLDEASRTVDMLIDKRGARSEPTRRVPASDKQRARVPEHLGVRSGTIDDLDAVLGL